MDPFHSTHHLFWNYVSASGAHALQPVNRMSKYYFSNDILKAYKIKGITILRRDIKLWLLESNQEGRMGQP